jgi:hypothetical protein
MRTCFICGKPLSKRQKVFCSLQCQHQQRRHTIETCREAARKRGGECLSTEYTNNSKYLQWRCANGHEWEIPFANILAGNWCEECVRTKWTTEKMHTYIEQLGGQCSEEYVSMKTFMTVTCPEGHLVNTTLDRIAQKQRIPCWTCKPKRIGIKVKKWSENYVKSYIASKGGVVVSKFSRVDEPLTLQCADGHTWTATFDRIHNGEHWCPHCAHNHPLYLNDITELGKQYGLALLSKEYVRASDKLLWKCQDDHVFDACWNSIQNGSGCPYCHSGVKEAKCRFIFEESFKAKFPQTRKALGNHYQLDGYNDDLKVAFEYQGEQHYQPAWYHKKHPESFRKLQEIDQKKRARCAELDIAYVEIPYWKSETDEQLKDFIQYECDRLGLRPMVAPSAVNIENFKGRPSKIEEIRTIIEASGGQLLAARYVSAKDKTLTVECKEGHIQQQSPNNIIQAENRNRGWCLICRNKKISEKRKAYWQRRGRTDYQKIKDMYTNGILMKDIADELKISMGTVHRGVHYPD